MIVTGTHARDVARRRRLGEAGRAHRGARRRPEGRAGARPAHLQRARVFVDDIRQCREDGEINVALAEGLITEDDVAGEIGKVICGELEGRQSDEQVTVFDSTGIALQDSATVPLEYERAVAAGRRRREEDDLDLSATRGDRQPGATWTGPTMPAGEHGVRRSQRIAACPMRHDRTTYAGISFEADMTREQAASWRG